MGSVGISGLALRCSSLSDAPCQWVNMLSFLINGSLLMGRPSRGTGHTCSLQRCCLNSTILGDSSISSKARNVSRSALWVLCFRSSSDNCCFRLSLNQTATFRFEKNPAAKSTKSVCSGKALGSDCWILLNS